MPNHSRFGQAGLASSEAYHLVSTPPTRPVFLYDMKTLRTISTTVCLCSSFCLYNFRQYFFINDFRDVIDRSSPSFTIVFVQDTLNMETTRIASSLTLRSNAGLSPGTQTWRNLYLNDGMPGMYVFVYKRMRGPACFKSQLLDQTHRQSHCE